MPYLGYALQIILLFAFCGWLLVCAQSLRMLKASPKRTTRTQLLFVISAIALWGALSCLILVAENHIACKPDLQVWSIAVNLFTGLFSLLAIPCALIGLMKASRTQSIEAEIEARQELRVHTLSEESDALRKERTVREAALERSKMAALNLMQDANLRRDQIAEVAEKLQRSEQAAKRHAVWAQGLQEAGEQLAGCRSISQLIAAITEAPTRLLGAKLAWVSQISKDGTPIPVSSSGGSLSDVFALNTSECQRHILESGHSCIVEDLVHHPRFADCADKAKRHGFTSCGNFPLLVQDRCAGILTMLCTDPNLESVLASSPTLVEAFCRQAGAVWERCEKEEQLQKLSQATTQSPAIVVIADADGVIDYVNPKFTEVTGYTAEEAIGKNCSMLKSGEHDNAFYKELWETISSGQEWRGEFCNRKKNGETYWEQATISALKTDTGRITYYIAVKEDVTARKHVARQLLEAKEAAESATRAKANFLANMSHEIRTPLNAIVGLTYLTEQTDLTSKQRDYLNKIHSASDALLGIINDILDFSKIEAGKMIIENTHFDLDEIFNHVGSVTTLKAQERHNELLFAIAPNVPRNVIGDPLHLRQILVNLTSNAVKFTDHGTICIDCVLKESKDGHIVLAFSVRDTGIGMTAEQLTRLFQAFTQADTTTTRKYGGTGLGLAICKNLVEMMGGQIRVVSAPDKGSTFSFTVPLLVEDTSSTNEFNLTGIDNTRILVVDDNPEALDLVRRLLEGWQFTVDTVTSPKRALKLLEDACSKNHYGILLTDSCMEEMSGEILLDELEKNPDIPAKPITIVMTAFPHDSIRDMEAKGRVKGILLKPFSRSDIWDILVKALGVARIRQDAEIGTQFLFTQTAEQLRGARILIVEDNEINQQVAQELLESAGVRVMVVDNGKAAVRAVFDLPFDGVLMDIQMPEMDGYEATRQIRARPEYAGLPILAMTANAFSSDREMALSVGMNDHIAKPLSPRDLLIKLGKWIHPASQPSVPADARSTLPLIAEELPQIPGIDSVNGLARVSGNTRLYRKLLLKFTLAHADDPQRIRLALKDNNLQEARLLAHTLKGVAGNVGAQLIQSASAKLEAAVHAGDLTLSQTLLAELESGLLQTITSIRNLLPSESPVPGTPPPNNDWTPFLRMMKELKKLLSDSDSSAADLAEQLVVPVSMANGSEFLAKLHQLIAVYDFDSALQLVDSVLSEIPPSGHNS